MPLNVRKAPQAAVSALFQACPVNIFRLQQRILFRPLPKQKPLQQKLRSRPADLLKPEMDKYREEIRDQATCEEDVLSYALFPKVAPKFFEYRSAHQTKIDSTMLNKDNKTMPV